MKTLQVDGEWVRRIIGLAMGPWEQAAIEHAFLRYGWAEPDVEGDAVVEWRGGAGSPHFFGETTGSGAGRRLELGEPPAAHGPDPSFVQLPCALFWPAFGEEPEEEDGEDDLDEDYSADWIRFPDAGRAEFHAEYARLGALLRDELGAPDEVRAGDLDDYQEIWHRGGVDVVLHRTDDINSYSHYDVINLRVGPNTVW